MRLLFAVAVTLVLTGEASASLDRAIDLEGRVHTPTAIYCRTGGEWPYPEAGGYALIEQNEILLHENVCAWLRHSPAINRDYAGSLLTLFHELAHVGWRNPNESAAECFALFTFQWEARHNFGLTRSQSKALYELAWNDHLDAPPIYQGCPHLARDPLPG